MNIRLSVLSAAVLALSCGSANKAAPKFDAAKSTVTVDKASATANGAEEITVIITTVDEDGAAFTVDSATVSVTGDGNTLTQPQGVLNGTATAGVRSTKAEAKTISVSVKAAGADVALPQTQAVTFVPGPVSSIHFTTQPSNVQVGAAMSPAVVVTALDGSGNVAPQPSLLISLRLTGIGVPGMDGGVGSTDGGVVVFDALTFDAPGTDLGMQAHCQQCSEPWADDATVLFNVTP